MDFRRTIVAFFGIALLLAFVSADSSTDPPKVSLDSGEIEGFWRTSRGGRAFAAFEGVPYARPPINELRFKPPQPAEPWSGVLSAKKSGPHCPQRDLFGGSTAFVGEESCLFADIYSANINPTEPLDVVVFVHPGSFLAGSGVNFQPIYLLDKDIVYVSFDYRLGALGFLSTSDDEVSGNNGLKDMVMLLKWVKENIAKFGGNPNSVTLAGGSAGAASVHHLMLSPLAKGLFHKAISLTGSALTPWGLAPPGEAKKHADFLAKTLGCPESPSKEFVDCLRTKTPKEIVGVDNVFSEGESNALLMIPFKPVVEGDREGAFLTKHPRDVYTSGGPPSDVPYMIGGDIHDGGMIALPLFRNSTLLEQLNQQFNHVASVNMLASHYPKPLIEETFNKLRKFYFEDDPVDLDHLTKGVELFTDGMFFWPYLETARLQREHAKSKTYLYEYSYVNKNRFSTMYAGPNEQSEYVTHGDELISLFPYKSYVPTLEPSEEDDAVSKIIIDFVITFAKYGRPTVDDTWKSIEHATAAEYMHIGSPGDVVMKSNYIPERRHLWSEIYTRLNA